MFELEVRPDEKARFSVYLPWRENDQAREGLAGTIKRSGCKTMVSAFCEFGVRPMKLACRRDVATPSVADRGLGAEPSGCGLLTFLSDMYYSLVH
ncbi:hypothetical protein PYCCODRAFT_572355 [Trametes coccinea BRFM310]|uniref:Uncharacterized protein n=1 Tax=Trametes coccinea (strain BRFM310) TaxID=1353009 RepID=A0A1Y2IKE0_TRAC3|nr:hypothetical protein PYCCODRAFT_572355 [Trametes coccinea BRFM310]